MTLLSQEYPTVAVHPEVLGELTGALETLAGTLDHEDDVRMTLQQVCRQAVRAIPGVDETSVTLVRAGAAETMASTSELVARLDHDQFGAVAGPASEAVSTGQLVHVAQSAAADRWPEFAQRSAAAGITGFLSAPLVADETFHGAINCYSSHEQGFTELDVRLLELYATAVEALLRGHLRYLNGREMTEKMRAALESRAVIDQAKGILMAVHRIGAEEAFTLLVERSQQENLKLRDIAQQFVTQATEG
ncbi:MAG TPA: GAF and ANTAR domain-containing protein [Pseudonocardiaceae bacterium]|jgi:GAF domain-containing protein|nr:GAF and ANTAR domain-containing protein [Pseudonocardiaceae bacterium]